MNSRRSEGGEERTTGVSGEAVNLSGPLCAGRDDSPLSDRLEVRKENGLFILRATKKGKVLDAVTAIDAQMIVDYVRSVFPVGTVIHWIIQPRALRPLYASFQLTANRSFSWLKSIPAGHYL